MLTALQANSFVNSFLWAASSPATTKTTELLGAIEYVAKCGTNSDTTSQCD